MIPHEISTEFCQVLGSQLIAGLSPWLGIEGKVQGAQGWPLGLYRNSDCHTSVDLDILIGQEQKN